MDPSLTRSQAHRVFGELYRKERPPELQARVDEIVSETSDVYIRINRIEELDKKHGQKSVPSAKKRPVNSNAQKNEPAPYRKPGSEKKTGILASLFGNPLSAWGSDTATLSSGFFSRTPKLTKGAQGAFNRFSEDEIMSTVRCLRAAIQYSWEDLSPEKYNTIMACYQFFNEYIKMPAVFRKTDNPSEWIRDSTTMQKYYVILQNYDYETVLTDDLYQWVVGNGQLNKHTKIMQKVMRDIASFEKRKPRFSDCIAALYALEKKKVHTWADVKNILKVPEPTDEKYRAPESVAGQINGKVRNLREQIHSRKEQMKEVEAIKKSYFKFDAKGKVDFSFLDPIIKDVLSRSFNQKMLTPNFLKAYKTEPHRLMYVIFRDLDLNYNPIFFAGISVHSDDGNHDVTIFKPGVLAAELEQMEQLFRDADAFQKKHRNASLSFSDYFHILKRGGAEEAWISNFMGMAKRSNQVLRSLLGIMLTVMENHKKAEALETSGKAEKLGRTRFIPIESPEAEARFLPYADDQIVSNSRLNGMTIKEAIADLIRLLYNYLFLYRDDELIRSLSSATNWQKEIQSMEEELKRMNALGSSEQESVER